MHLDRQVTAQRVTPAMCRIVAVAAMQVRRGLPRDIKASTIVPKPEWQKPLQLQLQLQHALSYSYSLR